MSECDDDKILHRISGTIEPIEVKAVSTSPGFGALPDSLVGTTVKIAVTLGDAARVWLNADWLILAGDGLSGIAHTLADYTFGAPGNYHVDIKVGTRIRSAYTIIVRG